jgi:protein ImuB
MPVTTAKLMSSCKAVERDKDKEAALVTTLCDVLYSFTPYIRYYCPDDKNALSEQGLLLEVSQSLHLFKGLELLIERILASLQNTKVQFCYAYAHSENLAWLRSFYPAETPDSELHCAQFDAFPQERETLLKMGFETVGDIERQIAEQGWFALQKRFSPEFVEYLNDILDGAEKDSVQNSLFLPQAPSEIYQPEDRYCEHFPFDFPAGSLEAIDEPMQVLLQQLVDYLQRHQLQCAALSWRFQDIYKNTETIRVSFERVYRDWQFIYDLSRIQLERHGLPFEIDQLTLCEPELSPYAAATDSLVFGTANSNTNNKALQLSTARLKARLGEKNVSKMTYCNEILPENTQTYVATDTQVDSDLQEDHRYAIRPAWILNHPVTIGEQQNNLYWKGRLYLLKGPERIEGHWWDTPTARDYFVAVRDDYVRLWVFHDLYKDTWFVQGVF